MLDLLMLTCNDPGTLHHDFIHIFLPIGILVQLLLLSEDADVCLVRLQFLHNGLHDARVSLAVREVEIILHWNFLNRKGNDKKQQCQCKEINRYPT